MSDRLPPIKPGRPGLIVRDPRSARPLSEQGESKPDTPFWRRRLRSGDAVFVSEDVVADGATADAEPALPIEAAQKGE